MVSIKMTVPEKCYGCRFMLHKPYDGLYRCIADFGHIIDVQINKKPEWCPLKKDKEVTKEREDSHI